VPSIEPSVPLALPAEASSSFVGCSRLLLCCRHSKAGSQGSRSDQDDGVLRYGVVGCWNSGIPLPRLQRDVRKYCKGVTFPLPLHISIAVHGAGPQAAAHSLSGAAAFWLLWYLIGAYDSKGTLAHFVLPSRLTRHFAAHYTVQCRVGLACVRTCLVYFRALLSFKTKGGTATGFPWPIYCPRRGIATVWPLAFREELLR
jgi:hypothetical protein